MLDGHDHAAILPVKTSNSAGNDQLIRNCHDKPPLLVISWSWLLRAKGVTPFYPCPFREFPPLQATCGRRHFV
jgi:hypothetical protein